jgi:segregation and condensation protein A
MREAAEALAARPRLGRDVFGRGDPEAIRVIPSGRVAGNLYDLMSAYIGQRRREAERTYTPPPPQAYALDEARDRLKRLLPDLDEWTSLALVAPPGSGGVGPSRASFLASTLSAGLELVKDGALEARQLEAFADIYLRARTPQAGP